MHRPQTPQPGFGSITLSQKSILHFKILDPRLGIEVLIFARLQRFCFVFLLCEASVKVQLNVGFNIIYNFQGFKQNNLMNVQ